MSTPTQPQVHSALETLATSGRIARITIDHPARLNVLNSDLILQLRNAMSALESDQELRCIVLSGKGTRAFIGGADIREMVDLDTSTASRFITHLHNACAAIRRIPVPVIARIQGYCLGAGLEVAASCDLRVASDDATFGMPEVKLGLPSVIEAALLPRLIGVGKARQLVFTGETIPATEAERIGLVERVVAASTLDSAVDQWASAIAAMGPRAIRLQKALACRWDTEPLDDAIRAGIGSFESAYETDEPRRLMQAFLNRKRP